MSIIYLINHEIYFKNDYKLLIIIKIIKINTQHKKNKLKNQRCGF